MEKTNRFYLLLSLAVIGIIALPVGIANFVFGYVLLDSPCTLCWGQRQSMIYIGICALFLIRYGFKPRYIAMLLLITAFGLWESFYHYGFHTQEDVGQGFGLAVFGIHTQFWAEVVFWCVIVFLAVIFFFMPHIKEFALELSDKKFRTLTKINKAAFWVFFVVVASNIVQAGLSTGIPPYWGQGDPVRFSWNPKYTVWSTESWDGFKLKKTFRGKRDVNEPDLAQKASEDFKFDSDFKNSPLEVNQTLNIASKQELNLKLNSPISDINYQNNKMLISTENYGLYISDKSFKDISSYLILDHLFSATVEKFVGANYINDEIIRIMGMNKTSANVKENPNADDVKNFRFFLEGYNSFEEIGWRNRLKTSRARNYYVLTARSDDTNTYMLTVPSNRYKKLIVVEQLNSDRGLAAEYIPTLDSNVKLKDKRNLGELYITGMGIKDGKLYAISKNYNTIIVIDTNSKKIVDTIGVPKEIKNIRALTFVDDKILVLSYENGKNIVYTLTK